MIKKIILSLFVVLALFNTTATPVLAQNTTAAWYDTNPLDWYKKVYSQQISPPSEIFGERYTAAQVQWVLYSLVAVPVNLLISSELMACIVDNMTSGILTGNLTPPPALLLCTDELAKWWAKPYAVLINLLTYNDKGPNFANSINQNNITALVFQPKVFSGITYTQKLVNRIQLVPEVQAQEGFGFGALQVLQGMWTISRNFAYGLLIFAAIIMSIMVMLRSKISPQAVITAQSAIPKLVGAIILITFSYAIAGFMVDLVYVVIGLLSAILAPAGQAATLYVTLTDGPGGMGILGLLWFYLVAFSIVLAGNLFGSATLGGFMQANLFIALLFLLAVAVLFIILAIAVLRIFFMLVKALVNVYLLTIFGPFYILGGTVTPSLGFGNWMKGLMENLLVFPAVGVLYIFSLQFLSYGVGATPMPPDIKNQMVDIVNRMGQQVFTGNNAGWTPPLLGMGPVNTADTTGLIMILVSVSIIFMIPRTADIIKGFFSGRPFAYGTAIGEAITPISTPAGAYGAARAANYLERTASRTAGGQTYGWRAGAASTVRKLTGVR